MLNDVRTVLRFASGLRDFVRTPVTYESSLAYLREQRARREQNFLDTLRLAVFAFPERPYAKLLRWAGITYADAEQMVLRDGVDATLRRWLQAGVYVTLAEFKGKRPLERNGLHIEVTSDDFDSPILNPAFEATSSGSSGKARRVVVDLAVLEHDATPYRLFIHYSGLETSRFAVWRPVPPGAAGLKRVLIQAKSGASTDRWFTQLEPSPSRSTWKSWLFLQAAIYGSRAGGWPFPQPVYLPPDQGIQIARWMQQVLQEGGRPHLDTNVSSAVRVVQAAREEGIDLAGSYMRVGGEPLTPSRYALIRGAGAECGINYSMSEVGPIGILPERPQYPDEVQVIESKMAVLAAARVPLVKAPDAIEPLFLSTVLPYCPKLMINVESGDYAQFAETPQDSVWFGLGFRQRLHSVRSYEKLASDGMNFSGEHLAHVIENVLPQRFNAYPTDFQFVESEVNGLPVVNLYVDPRLNSIPESDLIDVVLTELGRGGPAEHMMAERWREAKLMQVVWERPIVNASAKVLPLHHPSRRP